VFSDDCDVSRSNSWWRSSTRARVLREGDAAAASRGWIGGARDVRAPPSLVAAVLQPYISTLYTGLEEREMCAKATRAAVRWRGDAERLKPARSPQSLPSSRLRPSVGERSQVRDGLLPSLLAGTVRWRAEPQQLLEFDLRSWKQIKLLSGAGARSRSSQPA
jgi:hypothetical protein